MPEFITDLHFHSKYSRAVSPDMDLEHFADWGKIKGIDVLATTDFTYPAWFSELKEKLEQQPNGLLKLKGKDSPLHFLLSTEISCIYTKNNKGRRIHLVVFAPDFAAVEKINAQLGWRGNLKSDGRPILGLDAKELAKIVLEASPDCLVIPAHVWTPWFSLFGSESGFDTLSECFDELSDKIYAVETGLSCYDKKTEVLTENGWKKFTEIHYSDKICSLNLKNNEIEFQKPSKIHTYHYRGKMYKLKTKRVDLLVTPNHKLLYSPCDFRKPPTFLLKEAELLFNKSKRFKKDGYWIGKNKTYFSLPSVKIKHGSRFYSGYRQVREKKLPVKSWLKFFGFWIAEGWTTNGKRGDYNVCLSNQNKKLLSEMKQILESFGYKVFHDQKINSIIRVRNYQLFHYLKQFGKSSDKYVPSYIKSLNKDLLNIFFEYYLKGDGHTYGRNNKGLSATTISIRLRDDLQEIALKIGISAYYKLHQKKGTPFGSPAYKYKRIYKQKENSWVIYFIRKNLHTVTPSTIKKYNYNELWVNFKGPVYCVSVPNHVIYVRRNGIPVWCGNSDPAMNWRLFQLDQKKIVSFSDAHSLPNLGREATVFELENLSYNNIIKAIRENDAKNKIAYTIEFFPEEGKYHWDGHRNCQVRFSPPETIKANFICPKCGRKLTVGVANRVEKLADRPENYKPADRPPYKSLVPLEQIIGEALGVGVKSKAVRQEYENLIKQGKNEFNILINLPLEEIMKMTRPEISEGIKRVREKKLTILPGYDGVYGTVKVFDETVQKEKGQKSLF